MIKHYNQLQNFLLILFLMAVSSAFAQSGAGEVYITTVKTDDGRTIIKQEKVSIDKLDASVNNYFKSMGAEKASKMNVTRKYIKGEAATEEEPMYLKRSKATTGVLLSYQSTENRAVVRSVVEGSPADKAGLQRGDVIIQVAGQPVNDLMDFIGVLCPLEGGDAVVVDFEREGVAMQKTITLDERLIDYINPVYIDQEYASMASGPVKKLILDELKNTGNIHQISLSWGNDAEKDRMIVFQMTEQQQVNKVDHFLTLENITVAPNPTNGRLYVNFSMDEITETEVRVLNALGKEIFSDKFNDGTSYNKMIDLSGYPKGIYFIQLSQKHQKINKKVILQ